MRKNSLFVPYNLVNNSPFALRHLDYLPIAVKVIRELKKDNSNFIAECVPSACNPLSKNDEKVDLLERANWLIEKVPVSPQKLIDSMPEIIGRQYQGQWAIYACVMTTIALCNLIKIYPELKPKYSLSIPALINLLMSDEVKFYDTMQWHEDALKTLAGNKSHMTYLSLLAWVLSSYEMACDNREYDNLLKDVCEALVRRMLKSRDMNLPSFPNGIVFLPDMMVTLIALKNYGKLHNHNYDDIVTQWVENAKRLWIDKKTGLLISQYYPNGRRSPLHGSYSALNCTYLTMIDDEFAKDQYFLLKQRFVIGNNYPGIREYLKKCPSIGFHIDAGPIIEGRSPTGTAFAMGAATYFEDWAFRQGLLKTAELAGKTVIDKHSRHYKLAEIMLTGEAITLAMRTNINHY